MSTSYKAQLGYGFEIDDDIVNNYPSRTFDTIYQTKSEEDHLEWYLCIKKSIFETELYYDNAKKISPEKLNVKYNWNELLLNEAKKYNIENPKMFWVLCCNVG